VSEVSSVEGGSDPELTGAREYITRSPVLELARFRRDVAVVGVLIIIVASSVVFKCFSTPLAGIGPFSFVQTPSITDAIAKAWAEDPTRLLLPYQYEGPGRWLWATTLLPPLHHLYTAMTPLSVYLVLSSLLIATSFVASWIIMRSLPLSGTIALALGFGTQFSYISSMGFVIGFYLFLTYLCINIAFAIYLLKPQPFRPALIAGFVASLAVVALAWEWWLNYAAALLVGSGFIWLWERRHDGSGGARRGTAVVFIATLVILVLYLAIRLPYATEFIEPGQEEELIVTYTHPLMAIEDFISNFFTLLYMTLTNYLPLAFGSLSQTYIGDATILAEQHGYHSSMSNLVVMNHVFLWRFYAGAVVVLFCMAGFRQVRRAIRDPRSEHLVFAVFFLAVLVGCATHLGIKYRPYMSAPALTYKPAVSIFFFTLMLGYFTATARSWFRRVLSYRAAVAGIWAMILIAALMRPASLNAMLQHDGLVGYGDPIGILRNALGN